LGETEEGRPDFLIPRLPIILLESGEDFGGCGCAKTAFGQGCATRVKVNVKCIFQDGDEGGDEVDERFAFTFLDLPNFILSALFGLGNSHDRNDKIFANIHWVSPREGGD
jgi:hypothetical protein